VDDNARAAESAKSELQESMTERQVERKVLMSEMHSLRVHNEELEKQLALSNDKVAHLQEDQSALQGRNEQLQSDCDRLAGIVRTLEEQLAIREAELISSREELSGRETSGQQEDDVRRHLHQLSALRNEMQSLYQSYRAERHDQTFDFDNGKSAYPDSVSEMRGVIVALQKRVHELETSQMVCIV